MSKWFDVPIKEIDFSDDNSEMHFWLESNDEGNVYASAKVSDIRARLKDLDDFTGINTDKDNYYREV